MTEQATQEFLNPAEIEEEEEFYSAEETNASQDDESISDENVQEEVVPERVYVGGKAPRFASKAPASRSFATKAPRKNAIVKKASRKTKTLKNNIKYQYMSDDLMSTKQSSRSFFKITPLARIMRANLKKISDESRNMRHKMDKSTSDEKIRDVRRITGPALERIRFYLDNFSLNAFGYINTIANHGQRLTIMPKDIELYRYVKNL